jgi:hypothetical protein
MATPRTDARRATGSSHRATLTQRADEAKRDASLLAFFNP